MSLKINPTVIQKPTSQEQVINEAVTRETIRRKNKPTSQDQVIRTAVDLENERRRIEADPAAQRLKEMLEAQTIAFMGSEAAETYAQIYR